MAAALRYIVDDVDRAVAFYTERLGFEVEVHPMPGFTALRRGDLVLYLNSPGAGGAGQAAPDGATPTPGGWARMQITVPDLAGTVEALRADGATFRTGIVVGRGGSQILLDDPSGNCVELFQPHRTESAAVSEDPLASVQARGLILLGCGKMGSALLEGWLAGGLPPAAFTILEPRPSDRLEALAADGLRLNAEMPADPAIAVLAVKPQMMGDALPGLAALGGGSTLFLSIAAGTPIRSLAAALGDTTPIVRAMPNTPAAIGRGITALVGNARATADHLALAERLMQAVGRTVRLDDESQMDAVTALSGSGPAYVFLLIEALAAAGVAEGLPEELALDLARATVEGAAALAMAPGAHPGDLRVNVTSPGGTTAAALEVLMEDRAGLAALIRNAVAAAANRSRELAD